MKLFRNKKTPAMNPKAEALAARIAGCIIRRQTRLANYLNRKTQHWNKASKLIALVLFMLLFGGLCLYFIINPFKNL